MLFNSADFMVFFPIVVLIYFVVPKKTRYIWLLIASYYFYMSWNVKYAVLLIASTGITWLGALFIERQKQVGIRRVLLAGTLLGNLFVLFLFKYFGFFWANLARVLGLFHIQLAESPFSFLLPVGISFYTFQTLGYVIDVYRGKITIEKNIFRYALFVSFFPQLVAGPIERSGRLLGQIRELHHIALWNYDRVVSGLIQMLWGLFMKMVIADRLSIFVDKVFADAGMMGTVETVLAAAGFSIQIYCDFAGYSCIAIGAARVMGVELMQNFNTPYFACSIADFWRRWHISLSTWLKDYLYIPMGGSRCSRIKKYRNLLITFLVSGLWHGASWTYVIWGGLHGLYQIVGDLTRPIRQWITEKCQIKTQVVSYRLGQTLTVFGLTGFAWIFFRAESVRQAGRYLRQMFTHWNPWVLFDGTIYSYGLDRGEVHILLAALLALLLVDLLQYVKKMELGQFLLEQNLWFRWGILIMLVIGVLVYGEYGIRFSSGQFIYFAF
ncbi:MAG: MBOAT family protein [Lachnospiraceae bacterium]|nr:MBOAT family protein [Lachnospiraceae bacterium]